MSALIFIFILLITGLDTKSTEETSKDEGWRIFCKKGHFVSAIQTWYSESPAEGKTIPSGVRITCRDAFNPIEMQQVQQAFNAKSSSWQESRSCPLDEQIIGINLWPSLEEGRGKSNWNPQIVCRKQRRGRLLISGHSTCKTGHALCGVYGQKDEIDLKKEPSFKNYGIKCCPLPRMDAKKKPVRLQAPRNLQKTKKRPESKVFTFTLGPPGGGRKKESLRKPKSKPTAIPVNPLVPSRDFVLELVINPENQPTKEPRTFIEKETSSNKEEEKIPLISSYQISPTSKDELFESTIEVKNNKLERVKNQIPEKNPPTRDFKGNGSILKLEQISDKGRNFERKENFRDRSTQPVDSIGYQYIEPDIGILDSRSIKANPINKDTENNLGLFEDAIVHLETLEKNQHGKLPLKSKIITSKETPISKPFQISKDNNLLDIEILPSDHTEIDQFESLDDYDFVPVFLVKKKGKIFQRSKCLWPKNLPPTAYRETVDADLEVKQVLSGQNLIPVLLIKIHEGSESPLRECFWPKAKMARQLDNDSNISPEYIVLTP